MSGQVKDSDPAFKKFVAMMRSQSDYFLGAYGMAVGFDVVELENCPGDGDLSLAIVSRPKFWDAFGEEASALLAGVTAPRPFINLTASYAEKGDPRFFDPDHLMQPHHVKRITRNLYEFLTENEEYVALLAWSQQRNIARVASVTIKEFYSIAHVHLKDLDQTNEVYLVGENGEGKTLLMMAIQIAFSDRKELDKSDLQGAAEPGLMLYRNGNKHELFGKDSNDTPYFSIGAGIHGDRMEIGGSSYKLKNLFAYGANRAWVDSDGKPASDYASLFSHEIKLYSPLRLLETADNVSKYRDDIREKENFRLHPQTLIQLFEELMEGRVEIIQKAGTFKFKEKNYEVDFYNLSEGYRNILIWVGDMLTRLQKNNPEISKLEDYQAVVMVDEIDLHLHPRWQVRFVKTLRAYFPKIQFIFTTHSPIMLQGAGDDAVFYRVYRNAEGHTEVSEPYHKKNMHRMMFNTLMTSPLFGMESARLSPETEDADTSVSSLRSEIDRQVRAQLDARRKEGINYISEATIADLVRQVMEADMNR